MKKTLTLFFCLITLFINAQTAKDSLIKKMSKEACDDFNKKDLSKIKPENIQQEIGMILMPVIMSNTEAIEKAYGSMDMKIMQSLANDLGMDLALNCTSFMKFSMELAKGSKEMGGSTKKSSDEIEEFSSEEGTFISINPADITTLSIKDKSGKIVKLYWMEYFENSDELKSNIKKYAGKKVICYYTNKEVYNAATKKYKTIKVITSIELL